MLSLKHSIHYDLKSAEVYLATPAYNLFYKELKC